MPRFKNVNGERIEFTAEEETARDAEETLNTLETTRQSKINGIEAESESRINAEVPEWDNPEFIKLVKSIANFTDFITKATPEQRLAIRIHDHAITQVGIMENANQAAVDAYNPVSDPGWPS